MFTDLCFNSRHTLAYQSMQITAVMAKSLNSVVPVSVNCLDIAPKVWKITLEIIKHCINQNILICS